MPGETSVIYFSTLSSICLPKDTTILASSSSLSALSKFPSFSSKQLPLRSFRFVPKASGSGHFLGDEAFGHYPWESSSDSGDSSIQWVPEERVTLFTADGLIQIGGNLVPRRITSGDGLDTGRRLCIFGFCRSVEMLSDVVEDTVLEHGGEVVAAEKASKGGLHEKLTMTVAVPLLWGVPPASETLHLAVRSGGGIVEKVYWQWDFV
ncbi:uncharacterized protein LOC113772854 isoform X2 [Coffea eugenioides]|uniref:uncharacterized protein LOC113772854 isoform X2 n=1 Tax=Coffea eugenioides TaxID=49369 RepID=UPI000F60CFAB|nr:uncharacterized protein LOC113772854 isoform X2 [Coffea eugenioides]